MRGMKNSDSGKTAKNNSGNTFQGQNKKESSTKSSACGCGCKAAPLDDEVIEIEEDEIVY